MDLTMEIMNKIRRLGGIVGTILKICRIFVMIGIISLLVASLMIIALPDRMITLNMVNQTVVEMDFSGVMDESLEDYADQIMEEAAGMGEVTVGENGLTVESPPVTASVSNRQLGALLWIEMVELIGLYIVMTFAGKFAQTLALADVPFSEESIAQLKTVGFALLGWAIVPGLIGSIISAAVGFSGGAMGLGGGIDLGMVVVILLYLMLIYIFQYGLTLYKDRQ